MRSRQHTETLSGSGGFSPITVTATYTYNEAQAPDDGFFYIKGYGSSVLLNGAVIPTIGTVNFIDDNVSYNVSYGYVKKGSWIGYDVRRQIGNIGKKFDSVDIVFYPLAR